uniref:RING-type domain-containing protein n=1 Tax=Setaria viridis TaxID=4556 RepID=A0A4U6V322_SETVI|nr:hypothetical protein SEVIR_4G141400v2 [Setaria viridis]
MIIRFLLLPPVAWDDDNEEQRLRSRGGDRDESGRTQRGSPAAGLPSFTYNRSVRHNVTGEEAATCSVCLDRGGGAAAAGVPAPVPRRVHRSVAGRALNVPDRRSGTDPNMDGSLLPPV